MNIHTETMRMTITRAAKRSRIGPAFVLLALVSACGLPGGEGSTVDAASEGATQTSATDGEDATSASGPTEGGSATDDASATDDVSSADGEGSTDTGNPPGLGVDLGAAGDFAILAKSGISTVPASAITGDIGISPAAATFITGFSLTADPTNVFSSSPQVTGNVYASDYAPPTPSNLTTAIGDMEAAFTDAAGRAPDVTELGAGNIGGMTLEPGVYRWGTGLLIPTDVELAGSETDVWIFQIAEDLTVSSGVSIGLSGGARPENVVWQVAGFVEIGTTAHCEGVVLTQTSITLGTGASINGRLLAQTAVSMDGNMVVEPGL
jgi:hypothetical protein